MRGCAARVGGPGEATLLAYPTVSHPSLSWRCRSHPQRIRATSDWEFTFLGGGYANLDAISNVTLNRRGTSMRRTRTLLSIVAILLLAGATAQARVSYGYSGLFSLDTVTAVDDGPAGPPQATAITAVYPNPFNPRSKIAFELAESGSIELAIYDLRGQLVRVLDAGMWPAGRYGATWDGQDDGGRAVPTGMYFCRMRTSTGSQTVKLTLAR